MATSALLTHSHLHHRHPLRLKPLSSSFSPTTVATFPLSLRHSVERFPRTAIIFSPPLKHSVEHPPRTTPRSLPASNSLPSLLSSIPTPPWIDLSRLTPLGICKWAAILSFSFAAAKKAFSLLLNPFFWMYFSITWVYWPAWIAAILSLFGLYSFCFQLAKRSNLLLQFSTLASSVMWLTLIPPAVRNGFLEGWPIAFFFLYPYFFLFETSVRKRLYGDLDERPHDPKWDIRVPYGGRIVFAALIFAGHWLAAFEGPELHLTSGGFANLGLWLLIFSAMLLRYHSVEYLAKYSEKVVVPMAVVQFGPYRLLRHPIYASAILLFSTYCLAMRAPLSMGFMILVCLIYYGWKARLEEKLLTETFGEQYTDYASKVPYRFIPFFY